jgi:hypothetical protein
MDNFKGRKHTLESLRKIASEKNWKLISNKYLGGSKKHEFICDQGHKIEKTIDHFLKGIGCQVCSGKAPLTIEDFREEAKKNNWELLSTEYLGKPKELEFKCNKCLHVFKKKSSYLRGKDKVKNCPKCNPLKKKTIEEIKNKAISLGFECLSNDCKNSFDKLIWKCKNTHEWDATYNDIFNNKSGCPDCHRFKNEAKIKHIFEKYFNVKFLKKSKIPTHETKIELDGYNSDLEIAFEYNGIQHYKYTKHFHNGEVKEFEQQQERDRIKKEYCKQKNIHLIVIPYWIEKNEDLSNFIINNLPAHLQIDKVRLLNIITNYSIDSDDLQEIREKLEAKGMKLISKIYTNSTAKNIEIQCNTCNHKYHTSKNRIDNMKICSKCNGTAPFTIKDLQEIATSNNIQLISTNYVPGEKVIWRCLKCDNEWNALPSSIKGHKNKKGTNCPKCFGKNKITIEDVIKLAETRGHACLSNSITNRDSKLIFQCVKKNEIHIWETSYQSYKNSKDGCRVCRGK